LKFKSENIGILTRKFKNKEKHGTF